MGKVVASASMSLGRLIAKAVPGMVVTHQPPTEWIAASVSLLQARRIIHAFRTVTDGARVASSST